MLSLDTNNRNCNEGEIKTLKKSNAKCENKIVIFSKQLEIGIVKEKLNSSF